MKESLKGRKSPHIHVGKTEPMLSIMRRTHNQRHTVAHGDAERDGISKLHLAHETCCKSLNKKGGLS